jgi:hypothetical protein
MLVRMFSQVGWCFTNCLRHRELWSGAGSSGRPSRPGSAPKSDGPPIGTLCLVNLCIPDQVAHGTGSPAASARLERAGPLLGRARHGKHPDYRTST